MEETNTTQDSHEQKLQRFRVARDAINAKMDAYIAENSK